MNSTISKDKLDEYIACHECDALLSHPHLSDGQRAYCPRCGALLMEHKTNMLSQTLAVSLAGLVAFIPAIFMPMIGLETNGLRSVASLADTIEILFLDGLYLVSVLLFLFIILVPLGQLTIIFYLVFRLRKRHFNKHFIGFYRRFFLLKEWGMLEVFLLGIIVSLYKLFMLANVIYGSGLAAYCLLLLSAILVTRTLDEHQLWEIIARGNTLVNR